MLSKKSVRMHTGRDMLRKGLRMQLSKEKRLYPTAITHGGNLRLQSLIMERDTVKEIGNHHYKAENPVDFTLMGSDNETVPVNIILRLL